MRAVAVTIAIGLALSACSSNDAKSDAKDTSTTSAGTSRKQADSICRAAVTAAAAASDDLTTIANDHIDAFNTAVDALDAWDAGDRATFEAKAAEFRAYAANEKNQTARIETDKDSVARTQSACRKALDGKAMVQSCEDAVALLAAHREHAYELIAGADALYAATEQMIAAAEANNEAQMDSASSQVDVAIATLDAASADDKAKFDAADDATTRCQNSASTTM
jgi:hypothetical protein